MKLSSFHKQKGDSVSFVSEEVHLTLKYDVLYIAKEIESTPFPSRKYIDDKRANLIGKGFKYYNAKGINIIVDSCRPDYLLYETQGKDSYINANFITFFNNKVLINIRQDYHNTKKYKKRTIVADSYF